MNPKLYRGRISYALPILFIPAFLTVAVLIEGDRALDLLVLLFWALFLLPMLIPPMYRLEIGSDFVRNRFLGFITMDLNSKKVEGINYGGMGLWNSVYPNKGITYGKGLAILAYIDGTRKTYGLSEKLYGKEAIEHARQVLEVKS